MLTGTEEAFDILHQGLCYLTFRTTNPEEKKVPHEIPGSLWQQVSTLDVCHQVEENRFAFPESRMQKLTILPTGIAEVCLHYEVEDMGVPQISMELSETFHLILIVFPKFLLWLSLVQRHLSHSTRVDWRSKQET